MFARFLMHVGVPSSGLTPPWDGAGGQQTPAAEQHTPSPPPAGQWGGLGAAGAAADDEPCTPTFAARHGAGGLFSGQLATPSTHASLFAGLADGTPSAAPAAGGVRPAKGTPGPTPGAGSGRQPPDGEAAPLEACGLAQQRAVECGASPLPPQQQRLPGEASPAAGCALGPAAAPSVATSAPSTPHVATRKQGGRARLAAEGHWRYDERAQAQRCQLALAHLVAAAQLLSAEQQAQARGLAGLYPPQHHAVPAAGPAGHQHQGLHLPCSWRDVAAASELQASGVGSAAAVQGAPREGGLGTRAAAHLAAAAAGGGVDEREVRRRAAVLRVRVSPLLGPAAPAGPLPG